PTIVEVYVATIRCGRWYLLFTLAFCFCQAGDGIRYFHVTGVQTCALPICVRRHLVLVVQRRAEEHLEVGEASGGLVPCPQPRQVVGDDVAVVTGHLVVEMEVGTGKDRKSTRLNSSHVKISYAVFCLKKKIK